MHFTLARIMKENAWVRGFPGLRIKFSGLRTGILALMLVAPFMFSSPALAVCSGPAGDAGDILFNSSGGRIMQTCNGSAWKPWPRAIAGTWKDVNVGVFHTCAIASNNSLYCWGANGQGQVGNGATGADVLYPTAVSGGGSWSLIAGSDIYSGGLSCGLKMDGSLFCWGKNDNGNGGKSDNLNHNVPTATTFTGTWIDMDAGGGFGCAINTANAAYCWGDNAVGQWGTGSTGSWFYDKQLVSGGYSWKNITVSNAADDSYSFACGLKTDNTAMCWGNNSAAQLGRGNTTDSNVPVAVSGGYTWQKISAGALHACGIRADGAAMCWGGNEFGELGNGVTSGPGGHYTTPQAVTTTGVATWADIRAGGNITCGVKTDGTGWCWGYGQEGNIGDGAVVSYNTPHEVLSGAKWKMISPAWPTCGIMTNGTLWCWGENFNGAQGIGHTNQTNIPNYVAGSSGSVCSSPAGVGGDMLFNSLYRVLQWCDGKNWNSAGPVSPSGPLAGCTSPSGTAGDLLFNSASAIAQYCDGDTWRGIGAP